MTNFVAVNNFQTTLAAAASSSATTLSLSNTSGLPGSIPSGTVLPLTLNDAATRSIFEIVYVTAISGTSVTVERGQEGTTAQNWGIGDIVYSASTAAYEQALAYGNGQTYAADTGTANAYVCALTPALTARAVGMPIRVKIGPSNTNTSAAPTLNYGAGAITVVNPDGTSLQAGQIVGGQIAQFIDDGTHLQLMSPIPGYHPGSALLTSGTSWTVPAGVYNLRRIRLWGGGGSGANTSSTGASGGGSGGCCEAENVSVTPGSALSYAIGAGGAAQTVAGSNGNNGGSTSITINGTTYTAGGGNGGATSGASSSGGSASNGTLNITGGEGRNGNSTKNGDGGEAPRGGGGGSGSSGQGNAGHFPGGGSAGCSGGTTAQPGAAGAILIEW